MAIREKALRPEHRGRRHTLNSALETGVSLNNLGLLNRRMGEYAKAEPLLQEALRIRQKVQGPEGYETARNLDDLAELYREMGQYTKALPLCEEAVRIWHKIYGPDATLASLNNLALLYLDLGQIDEATALARQEFAKQLTIFANMLSFTAERQRLAYSTQVNPYDLLAMHAKRNRDELRNGGVTIQRRSSGFDGRRSAAG